MIAFNAGNGVTVGSDTTDASTGNSILENSIFANAKLGIDLGDDGVTLNDAAGHSGPNLFQDFPVLTSALSDSGTTTITGSISEAANTTYRIEFFSTAIGDPSGYGQGQTFLTFVDVTTNNAGLATFSVAAPGEVSGGQFVTATATDPAGNTSEFSADLLAYQVVSWVNPNGGDWDTRGNWSTDAVPNAADDVAINIAVSAPITHSSPASDVAYSVTSQDPITLSAGVLSIVTTADLSASLTLAGGTLAGGTVDLTGGATLVGTSAGGTLDGVTLDGTLDMYQASDEVLDVTGGLTLDGTILLGTISGPTGNALDFVGAQTLGGTGTITFGRDGAITTASLGGDSAP